MVRFRRRKERSENEKDRNSTAECYARNLEIVLHGLKFKAEKPDDFWTILGGSEIGSKAEEMKRKTGAALAAGFEMSPRTVLAMGFFERFRKRTSVDAMFSEGAPPKVLWESVENTPFNDQEMRELLRLVRRLRAQFGSVPIAVRSSAYGDARGTGTYESTFFFNYKNEVKALAELVKALKEVLASEFSANAIAFRKATGLAPGIAVMIEPVFGTFGMGQEDGWVRDRLLFGPDFGGIGYSNTAAGGPRVYFNPGMPTTTVRGQGFLIEEKDGISFDDYLMDDHRIRYAAGPQWNSTPTHEEFNKWGIGQLIQVPDTRLVYACKGGADATAEPIFAALRKLEKKLGPQYVEWAMAHMEDELRLALVQIADISINTDWFDFKETGKVLLRSNLVVHTGVRECSAIVEVRSRNDLYLLDRYNETHRDYIVLYNGALGSSRRNDRLPFSYISNAAAVVERVGESHAYHPIAHWETQLAQSGKLFFAVDYDCEDHVFFDRSYVERDDLIVHTGKFRVTASERQGRAMVERLE